jgi:hypothetical protein
MTAMLPGTVTAVFTAMSIAEEEIGAIPRLQQGDLFLHLVPTAALRGKSPEVYRAHARELVERRRAGEDLRPGTDAEIMAALSDMSLKAPLTRNAQALYEQLFTAVYGEDVARRVLGGAADKGSWAGAVSELRHEMRRKLASPERR